MELINNHSKIKKKDTWIDKIKNLMSDRPKYLKKETLAKRLLQSIYFVEDLEELDWRIRSAYQEADKEFQKYKDRVEKFDDLYKELIDEPKKFVEKYGKQSNNKHVLKLLKENPDVFKSKSIYEK